MLQIFRDLINSIKHPTTALPAPTHRELELCERLRTEIAAIELPKLPADAPASYREWMDNQRKLKSLVLSRDPRGFLQWEVILYTMFVQEPEYLALELGKLREQPDWEARWKKVVEESASGNPRRLKQYPRSSGNLVHNAYHMCRIEEVCRTRPALDPSMSFESLGTVLEFGGGYGNLCRVLHRLGFAGQYDIFDLPLFGALQRFYLRMENLSLERVRHLTELDGLRAATREARGKKLFVASWSLSETPLELRESIMRAVVDFDLFFIAYQDRFGEVDNVKYFDGFCQDTFKHVRWHRAPIPHLPGNSYLFGARAPA